MVEMVIIIKMVIMVEMVKMVEMVIIVVMDMVIRLSMLIIIIKVMVETVIMKEVQREIVFYPRKPDILEPRSPTLENREVVSDNRIDQGLDRNSELGSALWKGKGGKGKKRSIGNYEIRKEDEKKEQREISFLSKRSMSSPNLPPVSD